VSLSYREERRGDRLLDVLTDDDAGVRLIVSRLGAELISLARRDAKGEWSGFLWRDDQITAPAQGWANHATVMGYYLHRLKNERTTYRGHEIRGGTHSFLRHKTWKLIRGDTSLTYAISPNDYERAEYPYRVSLDLTYAIEGDTVRVQFAFTNHEDETTHVEFGLHPGFAATSFDSFRLQMPAGVYRRWFSPENFLSGETEEFRFDAGEMPFERAKLPGSYILELLDVPDRRFTFSDPPSGRTVTIDMAETPYVTIWSDGNAFLCVEPCWGLTDSHEQRPFEDKLGIQEIPPRGKLVRDFTIVPRLK
jgi:galactose mutarotase-like enzyme